MLFIFFFLFFLSFFFLFIYSSFSFFLFFFFFFFFCYWCSGLATGLVLVCGCVGLSSRGWKMAKIKKSGMGEGNWEKKKRGIRMTMFVGCQRSVRVGGNMRGITGALDPVFAIFRQCTFKSSTKAWARTSVVKPTECMTWQDWDKSASPRYAETKVEGIKRHIDRERGEEK